MIVNDARVGASMKLVLGCCRTVSAVDMVKWLDEAEQEKSLYSLNTTGAGLTHRRAGTARRQRRNAKDTIISTL